MERLALLAVTAHPGDELVVAGTLARNARAGVHTAVVSATADLIGRSAAQDRPGDTDRKGEEALRCACGRLGVAETDLLGFRSSGPDALAGAGACEVVRRVVHRIRRIRPQVIVTFGPDGIDGHVDHVAIGELASQAFGAAGDLDQFPVDGGPAPFGPAKLYYFGLPEGLLRLAGIAMPGTPEPVIAAHEEVAQFVDLKIDAARCYGPALEPPLSQLLELPADQREHMLGVEYLALAQPQPGVDDRGDPHLFAGIL
jgi:LmbE family N-acetylglucosaminyl deacetylase